jgi:hypothetical protein
LEADAAQQWELPQAPWLEPIAIGIGVAVITGVMAGAGYEPAASTPATADEDLLLSQSGERCGEGHLGCIEGAALATLGGCAGTL